MEILQVHKNHVKMKSPEKHFRDYFLLDNNWGWYCIQTHTRFSNLESWAQCLYSIVKGAPALYAEPVFKPTIVNFKWPEPEENTTGN